MSDGTNPVAAWSIGTLGTEQHSGLQSRWEALSTGMRVSYFQSWGWIGTWLDAVSENRSVLLCERRRGTRLEGLAVLVRRQARRHGVLPVTTLCLSETGEPGFDMITVEHNGPLEEQGTEAVGEWIDMLMKMSARWDAIVAGGIDGVQAELLAVAGRQLGLDVREIDRKPFYWADLKELRAQGRKYLDSLSSNTRYQIRRAMRAYEKAGPLRIDAAGSADEALAYLARLEYWHQKYWTARSRPGVFASPFFRRFHESLIRRRFDLGEVQLLRVRAGDEEVGYLYNLLYRGCVSAYQSGFNYGAEAHAKPGLVAHALAVERALEAGHHTYDFLAGHSQYKVSLSHHQSDMVWLEMQRPRIVFTLERAARRARALLRKPPRAAPAAAGTN